MKAGDVGPKFGRRGLDNGWISFDNVRIPRDHMMMKWTTVDEEGNLSVRGSPALAYAPLISERVLIVRDMRNHLAKGVTIATRYSAARIQGERKQRILGKYILHMLSHKHSIHI